MIVKFKENGVIGVYEASIIRWSSRSNNFVVWGYQAPGVLLVTPANDAERDEISNMLAYPPHPNIYDLIKYNSRFVLDTDLRKLSPVF